MEGVSIATIEARRPTSEESASRPFHMMAQTIRAAQVKVTAEWWSFLMLLQFVVGCWLSSCIVCSLMFGFWIIRCVTPAWICFVLLAWTTLPAAVAVWLGVVVRYKMWSVNGYRNSWSVGVTTSYNIIALLWIFTGILTHIILIFKSVLLLFMTGTNKINKLELTHLTLGPR